MALGYQQPVAQNWNTNPYSWNPNPAYAMPQPQQNIQQNIPQANPVINVKSREEAYYWIVSPGNSLIFRKEDGSAIYVKTVGYSPTDPPMFEEFIKAEPAQNDVQDTTNYEDEISKIWGEINALKNRQINKPQNNKRREDGSAGNA